MSQTLRYTAFLSYAHKDEKWAEWLHTKLEQFKIDKDLVGIETPRGPVPKNLRPIFLDRGNFAGGDTLHEATIMALDGSRALIVMCSTIAAGRPAVNEEVRLFKQRHPDRPIIPVLIEGTAPGNFPAALRYELNEDGTVSRREITVLGPDLRDGADGKQLGLAKVVAGLLGFSNADDIYQRAERHRMQQRRLRRALLAGAIVLVGAGGYFGWESVRKQLILDRTQEALSEISALAADLGAAPGATQLTKVIEEIGKGAYTDPRKVGAIRLLKAGKTEQAADLLEKVAEDEEARIENRIKQVVEAHRQVGMIAGLADPKRARVAYSKALRYAPNDLISLYGRGWQSLLASDLDAAKGDLERVLGLAKDQKEPEYLYLAHMRLGEVAKRRGLLREAQAQQNDALKIANHQISITNNDPQWMRYRSFSLEKIGDLLAEQGKSEDAYTNFRNALTIRQTLHEAKPQDKGRTRELAIAHEKVGDVLRRKGQFDGANDHITQAFDLRQELAKAQPEKPGWKRALSLSHERFGLLHLAKGDAEAALKSFGQALEIRKSLAASDPDYATWQRDLSVSHEQLGDAYVRLNDPDNSLAAYQASFDIRQRLAGKDPNNAVWKRDLSIAHVRVGRVLTYLGEDKQGLKHLQDALELRKQLAQTGKDPTGNARAQIELARNYAILGQYHEVREDKDAAVSFFRKAKETAEPAAKQTGNETWLQLVAAMAHNISNLEE